VLGRDKGRMGIVQQLKEALDLSDGLLHIVRVVYVCPGLLPQGIPVEAMDPTYLGACLGGVSLVGGTMPLRRM
jgi:hypothetical protein